MTKHELKKLISEVKSELLSEQPAPVIEPPTRPSAPPAPTKPATRPNPLTPTRPGIKPRPKALSHDVQAFINQRQGGVKEAIDTSEYPDYIDPEKRSMIEKEKDYVEQLFPDLGPAADRYLEMITSESYKKNIDRIAHYLNINKDQIEAKFPNQPTMMMMAFSALNSIKTIESGKKSQLEKMAVDVVLSLKENQFIKDLVDNGQLIIDAKLQGANLTQAITVDKMDQEMANGLTVGENLNMQINSALSGDSEGKLRRALANYMTQGDAVNKLFLFNQVSEELNAINPTLVAKYGILAAITQILYYAAPNMPITSDIAKMAAVGSEQVEPTGDNYTIKARAVTFPYLIHEIVKGIGDYLSMDVASQEELDTETLPDEIKQIMAGPALEMKLRKLVPSDKIEYLPLVKKLFYKLPVQSIKDVLLGGSKASSIINNLIKQAEQSMSDTEDSEY